MYNFCKVSKTSHQPNSLFFSRGLWADTDIVCEGGQVQKINMLGPWHKKHIHQNMTHKKQCFPPKEFCPGVDLPSSAAGRLLPSPLLLSGLH